MILNIAFMGFATLYYMIRGHVHQYISWRENALPGLSWTWWIFWLQCNLFDVHKRYFERRKS